MFDLVRAQLDPQLQRVGQTDALTPEKGIELHVCQGSYPC